MSDSSTPRLGLPYLAASQAQKHVTLNAAMADLDSLVQTAIVSRSVTAQPADPLDGQIWLVPPEAVGADWEGMIDRLARYEAGGWATVPVVEGHLVYVKDEKTLILFGAGGWMDIQPFPSDGLANRLINGQFAIWQRGTSIPCPADTTTFTADRWQVWSAGAACAASLTNTGLPSGLGAGLSVTAQGAVTSAAISQTLEQAMISELAGERVTLSGRVYASDVRTVGLNLYAYATPDTASSRINVGWISLGSVGPGWTGFWQTFTLPPGFSAGGQIEFSLGALGAGQTVGLACVGLQSGVVLRRIGARPPGVELWLCQRFYQLTPALYGLTGAWSSATSAVMTAPLQPAMRTTPACQPAPSGPLTVDCGDVGAATTSSFTITASPDNLVIHASSLSPPRTAGGFAGCNTQIACNAEI